MPSLVSGASEPCLAPAGCPPLKSEVLRDMSWCPSAAPCPPAPARRVCPTRTRQRFKFTAPWNQVRAQGPGHQCFSNQPPRLCWAGRAETTRWGWRQLLLCSVLHALVLPSPGTLPSRWAAVLSVCGPQTKSVASTGDPLEMQTLKPLPRPTGSGTVADPPRSPEADNWRMAALQDSSSSHHLTASTVK